MSLTLFFAGCYSTNKITNNNFAYQYRKDVTNLHAQFVVHHLSDNTSRLYYKLNTNEFLFSSTENGSFSAPIKVSYTLYHSIKMSEIADSGSVLISPMQTDTSKQISKFLDFKTPVQKDYILEITFYDKNRNQYTNAFINIEKSNLFTRQNFYITDTEKQPLFRNYIAKEEKILLSSRDSSIKKLYVNYYHRNFPLSLPPYSMEHQNAFNYSPDSMYTITGGLNTPLQFEKEGFYHIQSDTSTKNGITVFRFHDNYPQLTSAADLLHPLRYLTTKKEFNEMEENKKPKSAVDQFWLSTGSSQDRSKVLIRNYYNRVQESNSYFTSYIEGWKTDRGLIYNILGSPKYIYKTINSESWIYGEASNRFSLNFTFYKIDNPFTDNDYNLSRSIIYENPWFKAVEIWREGRIFNDN